MISIIIPFYRTPAVYFKKCIESLLDSPCEDLEIIVIDDGSGEAYSSLVEEFSFDSRYCFFHNENAGVSAARNKGIDLARGEWIMFVDSDDYVDTHAFTSLIETIPSFTEDIVICTGCRDTGKELKHNRYSLEEGHNYTVTESDRYFIMGTALSLGKIPFGGIQYFTLGSPCSKVFRTEFLRKQELRFDESVHFAEDVLFMLHAYYYASSVIFREIYLYYYVLNRGSATKRFRPGMSVDMDIFFRQTEFFLRSKGIFGYLEQSFYVRVQIETVHCMYVEFLHPDNPALCDSEFKELVHRDPYRTALKRMYIRPRNIISFIKWFMISRGWCGLFRRMRILNRKIRSFLKKR